MNNNDLKEKCIYLLILFMFGVTVMLGISTFAAEKHNPPLKMYENADSFSMSSKDIVSSHSYGEKNIGSFYVNGATEHAALNDTPAYSCDGSVTFGYTYLNGNYNTDKKGIWNVVSSNAKTVGDLKFSKKIGNGTLIIQKSRDGKQWDSVTDPFYDFFTDTKLNRNDLYTPSNADIKTGMYYRVLIFYEMKKKTGTNTGFLGIKSDVFAYKYCIDKYEIYLCYKNNPVTILDITSREVIRNNSSVENGFTLDVNGARASISVQKDGGDPQNIKAFDSFYDPGTYVIDVKSPMGDHFKNTIKVTEGLSTIPIKCKIHENSEKEGYSIKGGSENKESLTSIVIGQRSGTSISASKIRGYDAYGITGDKICLLMCLKTPKEYTNSGWEVISDNWGEDKSQTIETVSTGRVETGAFVVQTLKDGTKWSQDRNKEHTPSSLHTTDFYKNYGGKGDILVYTLNGKDVLDGVYIRILYAYEVKQIDGKKKKRCIEEYTFYLCSDMLDAVTFKNLTRHKGRTKTYGKDNEIELKNQKVAGTMLSGSVTTTGFRIDSSLNPTVTYSVLKNGIDVTSSSENEFRDTGKYVIQLKSAVGSTKNVTIYVDRMTNEETLREYFDDDFIKGKRIYSDLIKYPVFEGGETTYNFSRTAYYYQPLFGTIKNLDTGTVVEIDDSNNFNPQVITEPGEYIAEFNNNPTCRTDNPSGDNKRITFHFYIIPQGTAPGPQINKKRLQEAMNSKVSGLYPKYYGITCKSALSGYITKAFFTKKAARDAAYEFEDNMVEKTEDGVFKYAGSLCFEPKDTYDSYKDLTEACNYYADQAVQELYFDASDISTYITMEKPPKEGFNLRMLELSRSVVLIGANQEDLLIDNKALPIINSLPYAYQEEGTDGNTITGKEAFKFTKDEYECDSHTVKIKDEDGKEVSIVYDEPVETQLVKAGIGTGKLKITEETIYGDPATYEAVYFANGDNTTKVTIACDGGNSNDVTVSQVDADTTIQAEAFSIKEISDIYDPYSLVIVEDVSGKTTSFCADSPMKGSWSDAGVYNISVVNRIGNKYTFKVQIEKTKYATIPSQRDSTEPELEKAPEPKDPTIPICIVLLSISGVIFFVMYKHNRNS